MRYFKAFSLAVSVFFISVDQSLAGYVEYNAAVQAAAPVNYWHLSESLLTDAAVDVGFGGSVANNGAYTPTGVTLQQAGPWPVGFDGGDRAAHFDGVDGYMQVPDDGEIDLGAGNFTISMWLKKDSNDTGKFIYNQRLNGGDFVSITYSNTGSIGDPFPEGPRLVLESWISSVSGAEPTLAVSGASNLFDELVPGWHHIAFSVDRSTVGNSKLFVDGADVTLATAGLTGDLSVTAPLNIGQWGGGGARYDGLIDEVAMFRTNLSGEQLAAQYGAAQVVPEPGSIVLVALAGLSLMACRVRRKGAEVV